MVKISTYYDRHASAGLSMSLPSRTKQDFREEADVNTVVGLYLKTGSWGRAVAPRTPLFGDFADGADFHSVQNMIAEAHEDFEQLPSEVRERFGYDPGNLIDWLGDPENIEEARKLGLIPNDQNTVGPEPSLDATGPTDTKSPDLAHPTLSNPQDLQASTPPPKEDSKTN